MAAVTVAALIWLVMNFHVGALGYVISILVTTGAVCFFIALFTCLILGLPALGLARLLKLDKWWQAAIIGALSALIFMVVITGGRAVVDEWNEVASAVVLDLAGVLAGIAAWREQRKYARPM